MDEAKFNRWRQTMINRVNNCLKDTIMSLAKDQPPDIVKLLEAMNHTVSSGGKRLRALLVYAAASAVGGSESQATPGAIAVELIHAYSLIHDDLPALDNDSLRRGQPTCHKLYGEATAILAGDALQSLAFESLFLNILRTSKKVPTPEKAYRLSWATLHLAKAIGPIGMAGGQAQDLAFENLYPTLQETLDMERRKTGCLIAASLAIGGIFGGAEEKTVNTLNNIGLKAGLAYQITDDILNVNSSQEALGKSVGTDAKRGKASIVNELGLKKAALEAENHILAAMKLLKGLDSEKLSWLLKSMVNRSN
jgi:geranylgeranyl pyrophosphate synthase